MAEWRSVGVAEISSTFQTISNKKTVGEKSPTAFSDIFIKNYLFSITACAAASLA